MFNFLSSEGLNPVAIIFLMNKKIPGIKLEIKSMKEPQNRLKFVLSLHDHDSIEIQW